MLSFAAQRKGLEFVSDVDLASFPGEDHHISLGPSPEDDLILLGDPGRVRQILTNLLTNSIKFTSDGYVKMSVKVVAETSSTTTVQFCVEDTGIGIEEEVKKRLFRPFSQADSSTARRFGGTGLGLTISKNLVDLMKGEISLESKLDNGTTAIFSIPFKRPEFTAGSSPTSLTGTGTLPDRIHSDISLSCESSSAGGGSRDHGGPVTTMQPSPLASMSLPTTPPEAGAVPTAASPGPKAFPSTQRKKFHVLVVEDNIVNSKFALKTLQTLGFTASAVWNGKEALEYLLRAATEADATPDHPTQYLMPSLVLMDCQMPVLDGYRATHTLRRHQPYCSLPRIQKVPIVAMTASAIQGDREKCMRAGMDDYLAKPVQRATLEKMLIAWLTGEKTLRPLAPERNISETDSEQGNSIDFSRNFADQLPTASQIELQMAASPPKPSAVLTTQREALYKSARRSSLSNKLLNSEITGAESESARVMRRAEAEEKATSLRDAKLIRTAEERDGSHTQSQSQSQSTLTSGHGTSFRSVVDLGAQDHSEPYAHGGKREQGQGSGSGSGSDSGAGAGIGAGAGGGGGSHALTIENVGRLNADQGYDDHDPHDHTPDGDSDDDDDNNSMDMHEIPSAAIPPLLDVLVERELVAGPRPPLDNYPMSTRNGNENDIGNDNNGEDVGLQMNAKTTNGKEDTIVKSRGKLADVGRQSSEWSTGTIKPKPTPAVRQAKDGGGALEERRGRRD